MNRSFLLAAVSGLVLFAGITAWKARTGVEAGGTAAGAAVSDEERAATARFWTLLRRATDERLAGRYADAAASYREALALNDRHQDALYYLGNAYLALGRHADAEAAWRRLADVNPNSSRAYTQLGDLYLCRGAETFDLDAAEAAFARAMEVNLEETGPLLYMGQVMLLRGDLARARDYFDAVSASNYRSVEAHFFGGYVAWQAGERPRADTLFAAAVRHAEPEQPAGGVPGEGDTKQGRAMTRRASNCLAFEAHVSGLAGVEAAPAEVDARYRRLDAFLRAPR